jgi:serine/threonine protein kinase
VGESGSIKATIDSSDLVFHKKLGEGNFGDVWQGKLRGTTTVAIKTIRSDDKSAFLLEAHIMAYCSPCVLRTSAVCLSAN